MSALVVAAYWRCAWALAVVVACYISTGSAFITVKCTSIFSPGQREMVMILPKRRFMKSHIPHRNPYAPSKGYSKAVSNFLFGNSFGNAGNSKLFSGIFNNLFGGMSNGGGNNGMGRKSVFAMVILHYLFRYLNLLTIFINVGGVWWWHVI